MFGGGGMNPRKMEQMMEQMGIDMDELDATTVTISLADGTQLVFDDPEVTRMDARGQQTYQVVGEPEEQDQATATGTDDLTEADETDDAIPEADVELVVERTGVSSEAARKAIEEAAGDLAAAIRTFE